MSKIPLGKLAKAREQILARYKREHGISEEFKALVREDDRIIALLAGHTHLYAIVPLGEACGNKLLLRTGNFSYSGNIKESRWGWRELRFDEDGSVSTAYVTPPSNVVIDNELVHADRGEQDGAVLVAGENA
jgi:hypothetical protein